MGAPSSSKQLNFFSSHAALHTSDPKFMDGNKEWCIIAGKNW